MSDHQKVSGDKVVGIAYQLRLDDGQIIDEAPADDPLEYLHGHDNIIPGLESALNGRSVGDALEVAIEPAAAYGQRDEEDVLLLPHEAFPDDLELEVGLPLLLGGDDDEEPTQAYVSQIGDEGVLMDLNHPLAGTTLNFTVRVISARPATAEELAHGHAHQEGHHH